jgi:hypothetical protein
MVKFERKFLLYSIKYSTMRTVLSFPLHKTNLPAREGFIRRYLRGKILNLNYLILKNFTLLKKDSDSQKCTLNELSVLVI